MKEHKKKEILKPNKVYRIIDYLIIPLKAATIPTLIIGLNRIITAIIPAIIVLVTAEFIDVSIDIFQGNKDIDNIVSPIFIYLLICLYSNVNLSFVYNFINIRYDMGIYEYVVTDLIRKKSKLKYKYIEDDESWNLIKRTCDQALYYIAQGMNNFFNIVDIFVRISSIILIISSQVWWLGVIVFVAMLPMFPLSKKNGEIIYNTRNSIIPYIKEYEYYSKILLSRECSDERILFDYTDYVNKKWKEKYDFARKKELKVNIDRTIKMKMLGLVTMILSMSIVFVMLFVVWKKEMSIGMFIALATSTFNLINLATRRITVVTRKYAMQKKFLVDLTKFMGLEEEEGTLDRPQKTNFDIKSIEFKNVSFKYPNTEQYVLNGLNLLIEEGMHYAFVGVNGSGKTTITKLLLKMYDDYTGDILINGKNLKEYEQKEIKKIFSVVYQDFAKYQLTLLKSIAMENDTKEDDLLINDIIKKLDMKKIIDKLPRGMKSSIGKVESDSVDLSIGEWQKIALARCLYKDSEVYILDEPTASLDPVVESNIYNMFSEINKGHTTIFITHRLGATKLADKIVVLNEGKVVEIGSHIQLLSNKGLYYNMYNEQKQWYD